ncbi:hypothetical protein ACS0TY_028790 [Phlomoides rotata]
MATAVDIPAPVRETREEEGGELVDQATSILIKKLPNEEKSEAHAHNELSTVEGYNFLTAPSIGGVHCEVHNSSPNVSMVTEKPDQNVKDETDIVHLGKPRSDDQPTAIAANEETISGGIQQEVEESDGLDEEETKESKTHMSTDERVGDGKQTEEDTLENPAEFLHVAPENIEASILGQEKNIKSFPEDQRTNETLHENAGGETEEKSIVAVDTQKEILESVSTIASSSPKEGSINAVLLEVSSDSANEKTIDGTGTQKEVLESVSNEDVKGNSTENGEPRNVEFCENESTESTVLKIESKMEKSEDPMHAASEDINAPEIEARSCIEEQSVETHPQGILDEKTEDEAVDAAEKEGIIENVPTAVSIEKAENNSLIQVGGPKMENEDHLEKDADKPSTVEDFTGNNVTDEVKIDDENPSRAELLEEKNTESALLKEEVQKEKPLESLHAALEDIKPSDLDQHTETTSFLEEKSLSENPQEILSEETEEKTIDAVSNEDNSKDSSIQVDAREREQDAYLEKEMELSLTKASVEDANYDESINLDEPKIGNECNEDLQNASEDHKASASSEDIETTHSHGESLVMNDYTIEATNAEEAAHEVHNVTTEIQHEQTEENSVTLVDCSQIEQEEHLEKDGESSSWTEAPIEETKADESKNIQEPENKRIDSMKAELENEKDTESTSVEEEAEVDNPIDSLQTANHDIKASDSSQDTNNCTTEQLPSATPEELSCDQTEIESVDAAEAKEESLENVPTAVSIEKTEDNSLIQVGGPKMENEDHLEKDADKPSTVEDFTGNNVTDVVKIDDENPSREELLEEKNTESALLKEEVQKEKPLESLHAALEDNTPSDLDQHTETTSFLEERSLSENPQEILSEETEKKTIDAVSNEYNSKDSSIQVDAREMEQDAYLEKEIEPSLTKASVEDANYDESINLDEPKIGNECNEELQNASDDHKTAASSEDIETTHSHEESLVMNDYTIEATNAEEATYENVTTEIQHEQTEEDSVTLVDCSQIEQEEHLEKDGESSSWTEAPIEEIKADESKNIQEPENKGTDSMKAELENEKDTESTSVKEEAEVDNPIESLQTANHDIEASDSSQDTNNCTAEQLPTAPEELSCDQTEKESVDAAEVKEESLENVPTAVSIEKTEDNSLIQVGGPKMEKDADKPSTVEDFTGNNVTDELKIDDENPSGAELLEEKNTESALLKEEVQKEKPLESLHAALEDIKPSDLDQHTETTSFLEEKSLSENPQEILSEETEEKTIDAVSNEDNSKDSSIQVDAREREQDAYLEKEMEPSLTKASVEDANYDESINLDEPKIGNECNEDLQNASEDHKASASSEDIETTHSHEESLVMNDYTIEETNAEDTHEVHNVTTEIQHEQTEENSVTLVDCSQIEQVEHLEKDGESSSWTEAPIEETKADESKNIQEPKNKGTDSMKAELKNEKDTESTSVKEEAEVDNPIDSLQTANHDIEASDSSQDTNNCTAEQLPTATPEELSCDQTEKESVDAAEAKEESLEDIVTNIPDGDKADNTPIEEDGSQEPSLKDTTLGNNNAEDPTIAHEAKPVGENEKITECTSVKEEVSTESSALGQDEETSSLEEKSLTTKPQGIMDDTEDKTNGAIVAEEETPEDKENIGKTTPYEDIEENMLVQEEYPQMEQKKELENDSENTSSREGPIGETTEGSLDKEEAQVEKPTEDTKESESCQETYPVDEKILSANHEEIPCDKTEETTTDSAYTKNENLEVQNVENVPNEGSDNSQTEVEGPQKTSLEETSIGNYSDAESTIIHDAKFADENIVKADLLGNEESIECALVKEEVPLKSLQEETQEEKPIDSSQAAQEETKESDSIQDTNSYIEEKSLTAYPQEISSDKTERESIDAINRREESIEDIPDGDDAVNSPIEEEYSQKPHQKEATTRNYNDDESTVTNKMKFVGENEKDIECALVKEEVSTELLQVAAQGTKVSAIGQDRETSSLEVQPLTTDPQGFIDETKEDKTNDATGAEEGTPEDKDVATTPYEDIEENLLVEVDCKQAEQNEDSVNDSENTSLTEALIRNTGEGTLVKEEAHEEKHFKSLQVATEDFQASDSCQETSSIEEQILMSDAQEISCDRVEEKTADAAYTKKENLEEVATKIPNVSDEDNSPLQVDGLQKPPLEEASTIIHEALFVDESKVEADLSQNETKMECGLVQEEVSVRSMQVENEDIKPTASSQDREISQVKGQDLTTNPQEIVGDYEEGKTIDVTELKEEVLEDKSNATTPHEDTIEKSLIEVDCIQLEQNENLEKASENTSLTEAPTTDTIENILVKEKAEEEDRHIESLQVAAEDMQASASCQETSSIEEQILTGDLQEISCDKTEEKTIDSAYTVKESFEDVAINVPSEDNEDSSPIEVDGSQKPSLKDDHESTIRHDTKFADDLSENEKNVKCDLVKEEASVTVKSLEVEDEDTKSTTSNEERETGHIEEQGTNPQGIMGDHKENKLKDVTDLKEVTHEDKSYATISNEETTENSSVQEDCSQLEQNEHSEKDNEITSLTEALETDTTESTLVKEEAQNEDHTESLQVATEDVISFSPCQDTETSSTKEQVLTVDPEDISSDKIIEKTIDASDNEKTTEVQVENEDIKVIALSQDKETSHLEEQGLNTNPQGIMGDNKEDKTVDVPDFKEESLEDKSYATTSYEDSEESSFVQVDCSQLEQIEHSEKDGESTSLTDALAADTIERTLVKEEAHDEDHIESMQAATEDVKAFSPSQDTNTSSTEEQILTVDPEDISRDKTIENIIDASEKEEKNTEGTLKEDACTESSQEANEDIKASNSSEDRDAHSQKEQILGANPEGLKDEAPKEIENIDFEARNIELKEEEGSLKDMSTAVDIAALEEKDSDSIAVKIPCTKDLDVVEEVAVGHHAEDPDSKQEESSIKVVPEVHMIISHENVPDVTSLPSEVVEDANSGGDKTDTENIAVQDDGSTMIPTNETLPETDPRGGTEAEVQVPDGEKEAELVQDDPTTETDQKFIEGELLIKDSQVISEFKRVNDEEEKTNSDNCKDGSSNSAVLAEESTSNFQESRREMKEEAQNEEAQKQDEELHVSALVHDLSSGKIENQVQELEKAPLPASDENVIETTECKESETVEDAIKSKEGDDRTESFFTDKNATEKEQEEKESGQEKLTSDEKVQTTLSTSDLEVIDFLPTLPSETTKVDHYITEGEVATDREELNAEKTASDGSEATIIDNNRSITDLESKNDDEAPEAIQTTPSASEGQDVENMSVGETTALISECPRDGYEHANTSSATGEGPESKEFVFEPEEQRSEYGSKIQVLESVSQVQSCKIVAETEETKAEEKNLQTAGETESDKVVAEDISGQEETKHEIEILKENIPCQKIKEGDEDVEDYRQGSHQEEVIIGSHLVEEANQGKEISRGFEDIKKENEMETVPKISKEADDKTLEEPEENLLGKESINIGLDQKEHLKSVQKVATALDTEMVQVLDVGCVKKIGTQNSNEEINRSTVAIPDEEQNRTGADDTENEIAEDEGLLNQNSKIPEIDAAERELPKELDENIICEAPINTFQKTIEDPEVKKEQQDEHITRKHEILPLPELVQGKESEKQNQKDEICGSDEVQPRDEENVTHFEEKGEEENKADTWNKPNDGEETETYVEPEQLDFSFHIKDISEVPISDGVQVIQEDNESSITKLTSSEEECSNKSTDSQISTVSNDAELTEQASEATKITSELQAPKAGISSQVAIPNATEVESRQVEEANDKCKVVAETSTPVELPKISTSKITLEAEEQQTKFHDLPQELNIRDTEVMAEKDDPGNLQNVRDVSQDAQGSNEGSFEVSNKENPVEASPDENIETSEEQETEAVQNASVLETLKQETEQQQLGRAPENVTEAGVNCEEEKIINDKFNQLEKSWSAETEKVSESNTTAQHDNVEGSPRQIDSLSILPEAKCSEIETAEKEHFAGVNDTGVTELEVTTPPSKDKHLVLEADHTTVLSSENTNGNEKLSAECSGERDLLEPSKVEQQEADCGNEERTDQEIAGKPESEEATKPSLSDLFDVSMRETSKMAEHSATDEEPTTHTEDLHAEKPDEDQHENAKTEEEHDDDDDESSEQRGSELSSEAPVIVDMADADVKVSHKKSHNILSGVGSKVKHSIAKVKKAITGKSSHPKPPSPKKYTS